MRILSNNCSAVNSISKEWGVVRLKQIISLCENGIWGDAPGDDKEVYPVIRSTEIMHNGKLDLKNVALRQIPAEKVEKYRLRNGDILIVSSSGSPHLIGRAAIYTLEKEGIHLFSNFIIRIRPQNVEPFYLFYYLHSSRYKQFLKSLQQTSTGLRNLRKGDLLNITFPLPPLPEQKQIAEILMIVDNKLEPLGEKKKTLEQLKKGLMNDLLTGRRRVKVEPPKETLF